MHPFFAEILCRQHIKSLLYEAHQNQLLRNCPRRQARWRAATVLCGRMLIGAGRHLMLAAGGEPHSVTDLDSYQPMDRILQDTPSTVTQWSTLARTRGWDKNSIN